MKSESEYKMELNKLMSEYKMYKLKKVKIETNYDDKQLQFKGILGNN